MSQLTHSPAHVIRFRLPLWVALATVLAVASIALFIALGGDDETSSSPVIVPNAPGDVRYDGGPEEGTRGIVAPAARYDGGPEEGSRGPTR